MAARNLQREASARGMDPARLVFAKRIKVDEHLARHALADLFLDTLPCNAHTTASDALWAGLPVLTCAGNTFAGRVAASLLCALDLPELVTDSLQNYERLAIELAREASRLATIREKLLRQRVVSTLFDGVNFARKLESAFVYMHERARAGLPPEHFRV